MADLKITALPALVEAGVQAVDVLALADLSATETKKVTVKDLVAAGVALIDDADIPAAKVGTLGSNQVATAAIVDGAVTNVKLANSSISLGGVSIALGATDATPAFNLADATGYTTANLSGTITNAQLAGSIAGTKLLDTTITYAKLNLSDGDIPGAKIATGGITATQLAANSVTASELADDAVDTAAIADGAVVAASIATDTITANQIAANAIGDSELADNAVDAGAIAADAVTTVKILDANVTAAKLAANLPGSILATGAIGSTQLAANSVTASELADNAVDSGAIAASAVVDAKIASGIGGAKITDGTITAAKLATANIDRSLNVASGNLGINNTVTAATRSGITYNAQGLITGTVALAASDLPLATTSAVGGVSVGTGLAVTGAGALSLSNSVTAATISGITYNAQGQITATTALVAGDLPAATTSAKGAVLITSGGGISVDGSGAISTSASGITAGTYTKVTINSKGVATTGASLVSGDIPDLSATKLTSGTLNIGRFATNSILGSKFADSSVCQFTGAQSTSGVVTFPTAEFKGQFFYDLTNDDLYVYDGSAFQPVTITSGEIIYAGNYRADTNKITSLTAAGTAQGFTQNAALQAASAANNRYYFVCDKSGTGTSPAPTVTINPPDMILSNGATWEKLDISNFIAGQVASNIGVTATGGIQNTNVQSVLEELDTEKLNLTGGTLTGNLNLNQSSSIIFEGSTPDDFETTLTVIDPTADRTVSLPNVTGTLVSTGDTGTVTSTMILDGTILNADINASAAIALTKLANVTAAHIIVGNASNVPTAVAITGDISISNAGLVAISSGVIVDGDISGSAAISGSKIVAGTTSVVGVVQLVDSATSTSTTLAATGASVKVAKDAADAAAATANAALPKAGGTLTNNLIIDNAKQIRFAEADSNGANFVSLQAPDTLAADVSYTLPSAAPTANGQVLAGTTAGVLSWTDDPTGQWVTNGTNVYYDGGNVGIGTGSTPGAELHVKGLDVALRLESTAATGRIGAEFYDTSAQKGFFGYPSSGNDNMCIQQNENADFYIDVNGETRMLIDSSGNLLVGRTTTYWNSRAAFQEDKNGRTQLLIKNDNDHADASTCIAMNSYGNSWTIDVGSSQKNSNALTFNLDAASATPTQKLSIATNGNATFAGKLGVGTAPTSDIHIASSLPTIRFEDSDVGSGAAYSEINASSNAGFQVYCDPTNARSSSDVRFYIDGTNDAARALTIDSSKRLLAGTTSSRNIAGGHAKLQIEAASSEGISVTRTTDDSGAPYFSLGKVRTGGSNSGRCVAGDNIGAISWNPSDGTDLNHAAAEIQCLVATGIDSNDVPGDLVFRTNGGSTSTSERLRIDYRGAITVGNRSDIHSSSLLAKFGIDCHGSNVLDNVGASANYGLAFYNDHAFDSANGIGFFNDDGSTCGGYIIHQDKGSANIGDIVFGTSAASNDPKERLRIRSNGKVVIGTTSTSGIHSNSGAVGLGIKSGAVGANYAEGALALEGSGGDFYAMTMRQSNGNGWGLLPIFSSTVDRLSIGYYDAESSPTVNKTIFTVYEDGDVGIGDGNLTVASGHGIDFSAQTVSSAGGVTPSTSSGDETLDHYEKGTWTPSNATAASLTFSYGHRSYIRIGDLVHINFYISYPVNTDTGLSKIGGLPFAAKANNYFYLNGRVAGQSNGVMFQVNEGSTYMEPYVNDVRRTNAQLSGAYILISGCYQI